MFDDQLTAVLPSFDEMEPGPQLAAFLSTIDVNALSGHDRIVVLRAHQRLVSHYAAAVYEDMAAVSDALQELEDDPQLATESAAAEIRAALRLTRRTADSELSFALDVRRRLPRVWALLAAGEIDQRRARVITSGTSHLSIGSARQVVDQVIEAAPSLTTGQLAARLRRLCIEAEPDEARDRYREAVATRRVVTEPTPEGTAHLMGLDLPPDRVGAITRRINRLARSLRRTGESRSMDQLRADVLMDLLAGTGTASGTDRGVVDIRVDLPTLTRLTDDPGELAGYGPVIADIARRVAEQQTDAEWRYTVVDPETGSSLANGTTRRRPTITQRRRVQTEHQTCVFPGCRMPATDCDLDHRIPYSEGGPTVDSNLVPLCRHDHRIRTIAGWAHLPLPDGGHSWTSELGHTYITSGTPP